MKTNCSVEAVERRIMLSTYTVISLGDGNNGSGNSGDLRYVLNLANKNNTGTPANPDVISFSGVELTTSNHTISIGSGAAGKKALPAITDVVKIEGRTAGNFDNHSGLLPTLDGSSLRGSANGLVLQGGNATIRTLEILNFPGNGILVQSSNNTIGGDEIGLDGINPNNPAGRITVNGPPAVMVTPVFVRPPQGNIISGNGGDGVRIEGAKAHDNVLEGNFVGTDVTGLVAIGNHGNGVSIINANNNSLLGTTDMHNPFVYYNVLSGNRGNGLLVNNSKDTTVYANFFGLGADNATPLGNNLDGVLINGSSEHTVFGANIPLGNVTAANGKNGLEIAGSASKTLSANTFAGIAAFNPGAHVGNHGDGILVTSNGGGKVYYQSAFSTIILTCQTSGNFGNGIEITGAAKGVQVSQTVDGLETNGEIPEPNRKDGIAISGNASVISIGGFEPSVAGLPGNGSILEAANLISGNLGNGISILGCGVSKVKIVNSDIGVQIDGTTAAGNGKDGIYISDMSPAQIGLPVGSSISKDKNIIAFNSRNGVEVKQGNQNSILGNSIYGNGGLGIVLVGTANDRATAPTLISASVDLSSGASQVTGILHAKVSTNYQIEIFASTSPVAGNGQYFLGFVTIRTNSKGIANFSLSGLINPNPTQAIYFTSTATTQIGSTSMFSKSVTALVHSIPAEIGGK